MCERCSSSSAPKNASATTLPAPGFIVSCFPTTCSEHQRLLTGGTASARNFPGGGGRRASRVSLRRRRLNTHELAHVLAARGGERGADDHGYGWSRAALEPAPARHGREHGALRETKDAVEGARASNSARLSSMPESSVASNVRTPGRSVPPGSAVTAGAVRPFHEIALPSLRRRRDERLHVTLEAGGVSAFPVKRHHLSFLRGGCRGRGRSRPKADPRRALGTTSAEFGSARARAPLIESTASRARRWTCKSDHIPPPRPFFSTSRLIVCHAKLRRGEQEEGTRNAKSSRTRRHSAHRAPSVDAVAKSGSGARA